MKQLIFATLGVVSLLAFTASHQRVPLAVELPKPQQVFWHELQKLCGNAYEGTVVTAPANNTTYTTKTLLIHIRACGDDRIRMPVVVGDDFSRTWVLTKNAGDLGLGHDHRHHDGSPDKVTLYGGRTTNAGTETTQFFPAGLETTRIIPAGSGNIWWIELLPGKSLTYSFRWMGGDRSFTFRFDLTKPVAAPAAPWGWTD